MKQNSRKYREIFKVKSQEKTQVREQLSISKSQKRDGTRSVADSRGGGGSKNFFG